MTNLIAPHGGYENLKSFQTTEIIYDLTVDFCRRYIQAHKLRDQLEGAARSGSFNIAEGSQASGTSKQTEIRLVDVARDSQEELKRDMLAFLRQRGLTIWDKEDPRAQEIRKLGYKSDRSYSTYKSYLAEPESAANCLLCLINQACFLLDQQLRALDKDLVRHGDFKDRYNQEKKKEIMGTNVDDDEFLKSIGLRRLENGSMVGINDPDK
jgi:four helix bundle suffix protein